MGLGKIISQALIATIHTFVLIDYFLIGNITMIIFDQSLKYSWILIY